MKCEECIHSKSCEMWIEFIKTIACFKDVDFPDISADTCKCYNNSIVISPKDKEIKNYCYLSDKEIHELAIKQWKSLPINERTSAKSVELEEDLICLRFLDRVVNMDIY